MTFALHIALNASVPAALPFAVAWGLAIMSLDRWLVASISRKQLLLAIPRALLGLLFGVIISTPLTLQIFHVEIANQIAVDHTNAAAKYNSSPAVTTLTDLVNADQQQVYRNQAMQANGGAGSSTPPAKDPFLVQLQETLASDKKMVIYYQNAANCELYGGIGCSSIVHSNVELGPGPTYEWYVNQGNSYSNQVNSTELQIKNELKSLAQTNQTNQAKAVSNARTDLVPALAKLAKDQAALNTLKDSYDTTLGNDTGILASLEALDQLRTSSPVVFAAEFLLFLFFTAIEWLPIGVKVLLSLGPENTYEKLLARAEQASLEFGESVVPELMKDIAESRLPSIRGKRTSLKQQGTFNGSPNGVAGIGSMRYRNDRL
jgi:hypothetical protein